MFRKSLLVCYVKRLSQSQSRTSSSLEGEFAIRFIRSSMMNTYSLDFYRGSLSFPVKTIYLDLDAQGHQLYNLQNAKTISLDRWLILGSVIFLSRLLRKSRDKR